MADVFNTVPVRKIKRNVFELDYDHKFSCDMGYLVPNLIQEVLPGDSFRIKTQNLSRFAPMVAPVMHNIKCFQHYWFVPNRILFQKWQKFISTDLSKGVPPAWPYISMDFTDPDTAGIGSLADYLGLPVQSDVTADRDVSAIPFAAYQLIWRDNYRDQNLVDDPWPNFDEEGMINNGSNNDRIDDLTKLRKRAWQHDYFTSALPFQQKGPQVNIPIGDYAQVFRAGDPGTYEWEDVLSQNMSVPGATNSDVLEGELFADLSNAVASSITDLRLAIRLQEWFEKAARGGSRYVEQLKVHWNVVASDKRLNRPEYIGGTRVPVVISEVLQTSSSDDTTPQANMAGHGIAGSYGSSVRYYSEEHGYIIGIMSIMPSTAYQQGIPRHFSRKTWQDYAWPTFAHLSEQPILNKELYIADDGLDDETFGFIPRYSEYRYNPSRVSGDFRSSLNFWHMGRIFENRPTLNDEFIESNPTKRIFAVQLQGQQSVWCHSYHKIRVKRALPKYGVPTL